MKRIDIGDTSLDELENWEFSEYSNAEEALCAINNQLEAYNLSVVIGHRGDDLVWFRVVPRSNSTPRCVACGKPLQDDSTCYCEECEQQIHDGKKPY